MQLGRLSIRNYKSLRDVTFSPSALSAVVGPNAAGKSNFADAIHFLSEVYEFGLETAVARKGGYENIAFRKQRRSKAAIEFEVRVNVANRKEVVRPSFVKSSLTFPLEIIHRFSVTAKGSGIKAPFKIEDETLSVWSSKQSNGSKEVFKEFIKLSRNSDGEVNVDLIDNSLQEELWSVGPTLERYIGDISKGFEGRTYKDQDLFAQQHFFGSILATFLSGAEVYQFSTHLSRQAGVPTPNPVLSSTGENLPALVDWLQRNHSKEWSIVESGMREILPALEEINVQYLHTKTLGLFFKENGFGRPWTVKDVSDGTMLSLAMLVAAVDPRSSLLVIEEPENSVHPWILRVILSRLRDVCVSKNVILTSHSPILVNRLKPEEVWLIYREDGESKLRRLTDLDPTLTESWENGEFQLAEYLDSGAIGQAVPGGVW